MERLDEFGTQWIFKRTGQLCLDAKDVLHRLLPPHNPSVVGSMPTGPTLQDFLDLGNHLFTDCGNEIGLE